MGNISDNTCSICGDKGFAICYGGKTGARMKRDAICFTCAHWELTAEEGRSLVIDGNYILDRPTPNG